MKLSVLIFFPEKDESAKVPHILLAINGSGFGYYNNFNFTLNNDLISMNNWAQHVWGCLLPAGSSKWEILHLFSQGGHISLNHIFMREATLEGKNLLPFRLLFRICFLGE